MPPIKTKKVIIERYWELMTFKDTILKKPIKVEIIKEQGEYILTVRDFPVYAWGQNLLEVQEEIKEELYDLYSSLFLENKNLGKPMIEAKENLKQYLYAADKN
jgi:hypothetical protein